MKFYLSSAVASKFKGLTVASALLSGFSLSSFDSKTVRNVKDKLKTLVVDRFTTPDDFVSSRIIKRYQAFYRDALKLDLVNHKPKNEVYGTLLLSEEDIHLSSVVDELSAYLSGATGFPVVLFDGGAVTGDLILRFAKEGEIFQGTDGSTHELEGHEIVLTDTSDSLLFLYPHMLSSSVTVGDATEKIVLMVCGVPGIPGLDLLWALKLSVNYFREIFSGKPELMLQEIKEDGEE